MAVAIENQSDLSDDEERALDIIVEHGGLHQSELWKKLDVSSRKGSRLATTLAEDGLIEREKTVHEGRVTYELTPVHDAKDLDFSLLMAGDMLSPFVAEDQVESQSDGFSQWIMNLAYDEKD